MSYKFRVLSTTAVTFLPNVEVYVLEICQKYIIRIYDLSYKWTYYSESLGSEKDDITNQLKKKKIKIFIDKLKKKRVM